MTTSQLVVDIFNQLFGAHPDTQSLRQALQGYAGKETPRVQLAILKLSQDDPAKLLEYIEAAKVDYRDVLAWAEYPEQFRTGATRFNTAPNEYEAMLERDRMQYEAWLIEHRHSDPPGN